MVDTVEATTCTASIIPLTAGEDTVQGTRSTPVATQVTGVVTVTAEATAVADTAAKLQTAGRLNASNLSPPGERFFVYRFDGLKWSHPVPRNPARSLEVR